MGRDGTRGPLSPATLAACACLVCGWIGFAAFDVARSLETAQSELEIRAELVALSLADADDARATALLDRFTSSPGGSAAFVQLREDRAALVTVAPARTQGAAGEATPVPARLMANRQIGATQRSVVVTGDVARALTGPLQRIAGSGALMLLLLLALVRLGRGRTAALQVAEGDDPVDTAPIGIAVWTADGSLLKRNARFDEALELEPGRRVASREDLCVLLADIDRVSVLSDAPGRRRAICRTGSGRAVMLEESDLPGGGMVTCLSSASELQEVSSQLASLKADHRQLARRLQEERLRAEAASRSKASFLAHLSHEIRTPLNHIIGYSELIRHQSLGPVGDKRYLTYMGHIKQSGETLLASFSRMLELAELEGGTRVLRIEPVIVSELLINTRERFCEQAERAGISLAISSQCDRVLMADRLCLQRMLGNIVDNALRFTPSGGRITLAAWSAAEEVVLEVSDTGIGISEEQLASLQPVGPPDGAYKRKRDGGLGLSIARSIAALSGGELAIDSSPAVGTTVAVSLPVARPQENLQLDVA